MKRSLAAAGVALLAAAAALPASAKTDAKKVAPHLDWAHTYAQALEEARERGCVIFATFHIDH